MRHALFMMHLEKAPSPDGMRVLCYQQSWHIIKKDLLDMVNNFVLIGKLDTRLNITNICLIPKTERPTRITEMRPISLCNVGYKIISKVLCQRLKAVFQSLFQKHNRLFSQGD